MFSVQLWTALHYLGRKQYFWYAWMPPMVPPMVVYNYAYTSQKWFYFEDVGPLLSGFNSLFRVELIISFSSFFFSELCKSEDAGDDVSVILGGNWDQFPWGISKAFSQDNPDICRGGCGATGNIISWTGDYSGFVKWGSVGSLDCSSPPLPSFPYLTSSNFYWDVCVPSRLSWPMQKKMWSWRKFNFLYR